MSQQRVGLARALSNDAPVLLMDEAYSALDPLIRMDMQTVLLDIQKEVKKTIVFITHDLDEALRLGDKIAILKDGEIIQQGTSQDIVLRPADEYVASFVREVNRGRVVQVSAIMTPFSSQASTPVGVSIDAESSIEEAMQLLVSGSTENLTILGSEAQPVGRVTFRQVASAMVNSHAHEPQQTVNIALS